MSSFDADIADVVDTVVNPDMVAMTLRLDRELHKRIRVLAAQEEKSTSEWVREALKLVADRVEGRGA